MTRRTTRRMTRWMSRAADACGLLGLLRRGPCFRLATRRRQRFLEQFSYLLVVRFLRQNPVPIEDAARVGIHNKHGMIPRIEENRVRSLRAHPVQAEQLFPQPVGWLSEKLIQRSAVFVVEEGDERLEPLRLLAKVTRGPDQPLESPQGYSSDSL